jgi:AcrR family transcriptional regulator
MARRPRPGTHDALLDAAREEFARRGLAGARVEDIASRAGISKGAFYLHFRTKDAAFEEILQRFLGAFEDHALRRDEIACAAPGDPLELEAECAADVELLELLWRNRHVLAALDGAAGSRYRALVDPLRRRLHAFVTRRILARQGPGGLRTDVDPRVVADIVVGSYGDLARRMAEMKQKPDLAAWTRSLLLVLFEGMRADH